MSWSIKDKGKIEPVAFRKRREAQIYAGRRWIGAQEYERAAGRANVQEFSSVGDVRAIWKAVKKRHPTIRLVRVNVTALNRGGVK